MASKSPSAKVPAIIHQMWLAKDVKKDGQLIGPPADRPNYTQYAEGLKKLNPKWRYMWWNSAQVEARVWTHPKLARFKGICDRMPLHIMKCDLARYAILWLYGGAYFDLDTKFHRPIPAEWRNTPLHLFQEPAYQSGGRTKELYPLTGYSSIISNQPIICTRQHPLMWTLLEEVEARCHAFARRHFLYQISQSRFNSGSFVIGTTGPQMLTEVVLANKEAYVPYIKSPSWFFGTDLNGKEIKSDRMHAGSPECAPNGSFCPKSELEQAVGSNNWAEGTAWNKEFFTSSIIAAVMVGLILAAILGIIYYSIRQRSPRASNIFVGVLAAISIIILLMGVVVFFKN